MFLYRIVSLLVHLIDLYTTLIVAGAILSWIPMQPGTLFSDIRHAIGTLTEPFVGIFRRAIPSIGGSGFGVDFSPVVAIVVLQLLERFVLGILY